ncbi:MAG: hypothetical protein GWO23_02180 [Gammaproteobacteria bacterium]|nr:hypothetical protein [Gammaproteobacteria bacterium]
MDIQEAMSHPAEKFRHPHDVLSDGSLNREQKKQILLRWDAEVSKQKELAKEQQGNNLAELQIEILRALRTLC